MPKELTLERLSPWISGGLCALVYLVTQAPGLMYTDTGELAAAAATWGVAHPTGYPLLTLLGHVWSLLPWPSVIRGLNVLAALSTAGGVAMLTITLQHLLRSFKKSGTWISLATGMLFGFCPLVWSQSTAYEVYSLNLLLIASTLYAAVRAREGNSVSFTALAGLLFGLALANHLSSVFLAPGLLVIWWQQGRSRSQWLALFLPMLLGLSLYALLPLRSATLPPINWGWVHRSWDAFFYHVKGTQFGVWMFSDTKAFSSNAVVFLREVSRMLLWAGWIPVFVGIVELFRTRRSLASGLLLVLAGNLIISFGYAIPDIDAYFLPSAMMLAVFFGVGLSRLLAKASSPLQLATLALPLVAIGLNVQHMNYREHRAVEAYARWTWANMEPNAIIITRQWDYLASAMWYLQTVEHVRPDVTIIDKELLRRTWYLPQLTHLYPDALKGAQVAIADYMPWLESFEADADAFMKVPSNPPNIQRRYLAVLNALLEDNASRPCYVTAEVLREEKGLAPNWLAWPVGPLYRLTRDTALHLHTATDGLDVIYQSLLHRDSRLDKGLRETVMSGLGADAIYTFLILRDSTEGRKLRDRTVAFDPRSHLARTIQTRIP